MTPRHRRYLMSTASQLMLNRMLPPLTQETFRRVLEPWARWLAMVRA